MFKGNVTSGVNESIWLHQLKHPFLPQLNESVNTDVCIIGGGISGLSIAYQLSLAGKSVVVLEDGKIGSGETGRTSAHLTAILDNRYYALARLYNQVDLRLLVESHSEAIGQIELISQKENIDCDFKRVDGILFLGKNDKLSTLKKELKACQHIGLKAELIELELFNHKKQVCLRIPNQAQFHPLKYLFGLADVIQKRKGLIFEHTHASDFVFDQRIQIKTAQNQTVTADHLVIATHIPVFDKSHIFAKQRSNRTYMIGIRAPKNYIANGLYWDTENPYHYVRINPFHTEYDLITVGGEDHNTGFYQDVNHKFDHLKQWAMNMMPTLTEVEFQWSGQIIEPVDSHGFIGKASKNKEIYIASAYSGNGLTHGVISSLLIPELIVGNPHPWETLYDPRRWGAKGMINLLKDNAQAIATFAKYITPGDRNCKINNLPDEGCILREGLKKCAVYNDISNTKHKKTAICPHMGSILSWNPIEKSWDCPAHGSRFTAFGDVIHGPANSDLKSKK